MIKPIRLDIGWSSAIRIPSPPAGAWPILGTMLLCNQPLGPSITVVLFVLFTAVLAATRRLPFKAVATSLVVLVAYVLILIANSIFISESANLFLFYSFYLSLCIVFFMVIRSSVQSLSAEDREKTVLLLLIMDLVLNVPAVLFQLGMHGVGDFISGLSGIFNQGSLSQGRTNSVRAGMIMVLAMARYARKKDGLSLLSAGFNMVVLVVALSMTTILSAFGAGLVSLFLVKKQTNRLIKLILIIGIAVAGGIFNQMKYGVSYADYVLALNYHFQVTPKLNIYKFVFEDLIPQRPWTLLVGNGLGNLLNRFAILFNFENYAGFPFKAELQQIFYSSETKENIINRYYLESGVVGNSIISVPWSSGLAILLETGLVGCALILLSLRKFISDALKVNNGVIGSGVFFLAFFGLNLLWDVYLDYPEVYCAFVILGLLLGATYKVEKARLS